MTARAPLTRWSLISFVAALALGAAGWVHSGGGIFDPGGLRDADPDARPLHGVTGHSELKRDCGSCHAPPWSAATMDVRCARCHDDVRAELTDTTTLHGALAADDCVDCHTEHAGARAELTRIPGGGAWHDRLGFSLAQHERTAAGGAFVCGDCHDGGGWAVSDDDCTSCHRDYQAGFIDSHTREFGPECRACHDGRTNELQDHEFPVDHGERRASRCVVCHDDAPETYETWTCYGCHEHTPAGIRAEHLEEGIDDYTDCMECHPTGEEDEHEGRRVREGRRDSDGGDDDD